MSDSKIKLLEWVNDTLQLRYTKVEQLGTGIAYCQLLDAIYGDIQLSKLKFHNQHERAYIDNFKAVQKSFEKHNIDKIIPVDRLVKCKFQDNLEFLQWFKSFWNKNNNGQPYDAAAKRQKVMAKQALALGSNQSPSSLTSPQRVSLSTSTSTNKTMDGDQDNKRNGKKPMRANKRNHASSSSSTTCRPTSNKITELQEKIVQLQTTISMAQAENQLYQAKLESIKRILAKSQSLKYSKPGSMSNTLKKISSILYSEKDDVV